MSFGKVYRKDESEDLPFAKGEIASGIRRWKDVSLRYMC